MMVIRKLLDHNSASDEIEQEGRTLMRDANGDPNVLLAAVIAMKTPESGRVKTITGWLKSKAKSLSADGMADELLQRVLGLRYPTDLCSIFLKDNNGVPRHELESLVGDEIQRMRSEGIDYEITKNTLLDRLKVDVQHGWPTDLVGKVRDRLEAELRQDRQFRAMPPASAFDKTIEQLRRDGREHEDIRKSILESIDAARAWYGLNESEVKRAIDCAEAAFARSIPGTRAERLAEEKAQDEERRRLNPNWYPKRPSQAQSANPGMASAKGDAVFSEAQVEAMRRQHEQWRVQARLGMGHPSPVSV
jgi:hypothetical protein